MKPVALFILLTSCAARSGAPKNISEAPSEVRQAETAEEFRFGPGDRIQISVWRHDELDMDVLIAPDGSITYPIVGRVVVAGLTYTELVERLTSALREYYEDPQVAVNVSELTNQKVIVLGEVANPTVLQIANELSIVEAITLAGGFSSTSKTRNVLLVRGGMEQPVLYTVDVDSIFAEGDMSQMVYLQRGDIVVVPTRTITNVSRYFREVQGIMAPFVAGTAIYRNAVSGGAQGTSSVLE